MSNETLKTYLENTSSKNLLIFDNKKQKHMNRIPTQTENSKGLHARYFIQKIVHPNIFEEPGMKLAPVDEGSEYFVMRLDKGGSDIEHIKACRIGVHAYADAIEHHLPELAKDLKERYPLITR